MWHRDKIYMRQLPRERISVCMCECWDLEHLNFIIITQFPFLETLYFSFSLLHQKSHNKCRKEANMWSNFGSEKTNFPYLRNLVFFSFLFCCTGKNNDNACGQWSFISNHSKGKRSSQNSNRICNNHRWLLCFLLNVS